MTLPDDELDPNPPPVVESPFPLPEAPPPTGPPPVPTLFTTTEPILHAVIGAQFGDLEYDVGKSVRWLMYFTDRHFILDVNLGDTRYYVVNWSETFRNAQHGVTGINFFVRPVDFRKEQFKRADAAWNFNDEDWVLFCDAHEGFSVDNRTLPDDWAMDPFKSYLYREVARAVGAGKDWACIPYFAFVKHDDITNVEYAIGQPGVAAGDLLANAVQPIAVPYYIPAQGLRRLIKVSALRDPEFDWTTLDTLGTPDAGVKVQLISYAHAHWNLQDIVPPATEPEPINATNDDGWKMRKLISQVRPIAGLPYADPWKDPSQDDQGLPGPTADVVSYVPIQLAWTGSAASIGMTGIAGAFSQYGGVWQGSVAALGVQGISSMWGGGPMLRSVGVESRIVTDPAVAGITSPLYETVFRINLRDGVWYEPPNEVLGNIPLRWNEATQTWEPSSYTPEEWVPDNFVAQPIP